MKKSFSVFLILLLMTANTYAMTLKEMVGEVANTNPAAQEQFKNYNSVYQELEKAKGGYLPKFDVYGGVGHEWVKNNNTNFNEEDSDVWQIRGVVRQDLFTGFGVSNDVKKQRARLYSAKYQYFNEVNNLTFETSRQYLETLRNMQLYNISIEIVKKQTDYLTMIKDRVDSGLEPSSDLERANAKLANLQTENIMRENAYQESLIKLQRLLGRFVEGSELRNPGFDPVSVPSGLQAGMDILSTSNPMLVSSLYDIDYQHYNHKQSRSEYYPTVYAELSHDINNDMGGVQGKEIETKAMLMVHYNIFNGTKDMKEVQKNVSLYQKSVDTKNRVARDLSNDYQLTWSAHRLLGKQISFLQKNRNSMMKVLKSYRSEYKIGKRKLIDIMDTENEIYNINSKIIGANFDLLTYKYKLLYTLGTLPQALGVELPVEYGKAEELPRFLDKLPVNPDLDNDNVTDTADFCQNSKGEEVLSGCDKRSTDMFLSYPFSAPKPVIRTNVVNTVEELKEVKLTTNKAVITGFGFFEENSIELSERAVELMREIVTQLREVSSSNSVDVFVYSNDHDTENSNYVLSSARAYNLFRIFLKNDISRSSLVAYAKKHEEQEGRPANYIEIVVKDEAEEIDNVYEIFSNFELSFITEDNVENDIGTLSDEGLETLKQYAIMAKTAGTNIALDVINFSYDKKLAVDNKRVGDARADVVAEELRKLDLENVTITSFGIDHELSEDDITTNIDTAKNRTYLILHK